jgi:hypothetical protein
MSTGDVHILPSSTLRESQTVRCNGTEAPAPLKTTPNSNAATVRLVRRPVRAGAIPPKLSFTGLTSSLPLNPPPAGGPLP